LLKFLKYDIFPKIVNNNWIRIKYIKDTMLHSFPSLLTFQPINLRGFYCYALPRYPAYQLLQKKGAVGITKTPFLYGEKEGVTPYKHTNEKALN
jgi:hypothetical protein